MWAALTALLESRPRLEDSSPRRALVVGMRLLMLVRALADAVPTKSGRGAVVVVLVWLV